MTAVAVVERMELAESPLEFWARVQKDDGAALRSLAARMAEMGAVGTLMRFGCPPADYDVPVSFDIDVRDNGAGGGTIFVHWDARHARFEGELVATSFGRYASRLELSASYIPVWPVTTLDRVTLQVMAEEAGRALLRRLAAGAVGPFVPLPMEAAAATAGSPERWRVLIEDEDPAWHQLIARLCDPGEYDFMACPGPALAEGGCPLLSGEPCPKLEWADTVLHSLDPAEPANAAVLAGLRRKWADGSLTLIGGEPPTYCFSWAAAGTTGGSRSRPAG
jgi:hypothetical protein